jgi:hypothetical protein
LGFDNVIYMYKQARRNGYVEEISRFEIWCLCPLAIGYPHDLCYLTIVEL